jgi:hypothetical protein
LAAGELVRVAESEARAQPHFVQCPDDALFDIGKTVDRQRLQQQPVDGLARVQRTIRILEHHLHFAIKCLVAALT